MTLWTGFKQQHSASDEVKSTLTKKHFTFITQFPYFSMQFPIDKNFMIFINRKIDLLWD